MMVLAAAVLVGACAGKDNQQAAAADSLGRDLELAPVDSSVALNDQPTTQAPTTQPSTNTGTTSPRPSTPRPSNPSPSNPAPNNPSNPAPTQPAATGPLTLASGTTMRATMNDSITSRINKNRDTVIATVSADVLDPNGRVVVPAGSTAKFYINQIAPAENKSATDGVLVLRLASVTVRGTEYRLTGRVSSVEHSLKGRGVGAGDVAKVGGGAAAGAVAGRVLGGKKGTVIGGIVGAAVGTGVAVETADRDIVVAVGAPIVWNITQPLTVTP
jgi:hypothetical protein